jgi:hypothetical protein
MNPENGIDFARKIYVSGTLAVGRAYDEAMNNK